MLHNRLWIPEMKMKSFNLPSLKRAVFITLLLLMPPLLQGCIRTRAIIQSEPSGAKVTMNNKVYGYTREGEPLEIMLNWYWFHDFVLERPGYEDYTEQVRVKAPPYAWLPVDFFFEVLPVVILQEKKLNFVMEKLPPDSAPEAILRP